jgi:hypothetical protein
MPTVGEWVGVMMPTVGEWVGVMVPTVGEWVGVMMPTVGEWVGVMMPTVRENRPERHGIGSHAWQGVQPQQQRGSHQHSSSATGLIERENHTRRQRYASAPTAGPHVGLAAHSCQCCCQWIAACSRGGGGRTGCREVGFSATIGPSGRPRAYAWRCG